MPKKIVILTTGQPSTNPRMVKEYKALKQAGYEVHVYYAFWTTWAVEADRQLFESGDLASADFTMVAGSPSVEKLIYFWSRLRNRIARKLLAKSGYRFQNVALSRPATFLTQAAKKHRANLYIAHNLGALPAAQQAAETHKARVLFDVEDFYSGQFRDKDTVDYQLARTTERQLLPLCDGLTFSSEQIRSAYADLASSIPAATIYNVVEKAFVADGLARAEPSPLRFAWFSQKIGASRGLETIVEALNTIDSNAYELHLLGECSEDYKGNLLGLSQHPQCITFHSTMPYYKIFDFLRDKHIGLATETARDENNDLALSNKLFAYLGAGVAVLASDTRAQKEFLQLHPQVGFLYHKNDAQSCASVIATLLQDHSTVQRARQAALALASSSLNWEMEQKKLIGLVEQLIGKP